MRCPSLLLTCALALAACNATIGPVGRNGPSPGRSAAAAGASPRAIASPTASAAPQAGDAAASAPTLSLPARLGLALPASVVGAAGRLGLTGGDGKVGFQGSQLQLLPGGQIVANNSGALISDAGGNLIANNSGSIVSNNSGSNQAQPGLGWRHLAQASPEANEVENNPLEDPRLHLWLALNLIDLNDQVILAYLKGKPQVGRWHRYTLDGMRILPPPVLTELAAPLLGRLVEQFKALHLAGHLADEGGQPHLRVVVLPAEGAPVAEGAPILDLMASGPNEAVARTRFPSAIGTEFGLDGSAARIVSSATAEGRALRMEVAEHYLPVAQRAGLAMLLTGPTPTRASRRSLVMNAPQGPVNSGFVGSTVVAGMAPPWRHDEHYVGLGYASVGVDDPGLAYFSMRRFGPIGAVGGFTWTDPFREPNPPATPPALVHFMNQAGVLVRSPGPQLTRLAPPYLPGDERAIPTALQADEDPTQDALLKLPPLPAALLQAPSAP